MLLEISALTKKFGGLQALSDFNVALEEGSATALIGPNGSGKTTAFNLASGFYKPTSGTIRFAGQDIRALKPHEITALGMARTFQNIRLWKSQTVFNNVLIAKHMLAKSNVFTATFRLNRKEEAQQRAETLELLKLVGLDDVKDELATNLPYGRQRRLEIARALATKPKLLLLDEPAAGMNPQETLELADFVHEIRANMGLTVFMIEHHMDMVMKISDRIYVLDFGKLIAQGVPSEIQSNQCVIDAYLGVTEDA